jgi:predicted MFS family arabinose efflux permease
MSDEAISEEKSPAGRWFVPSLVIASFAVSISVPMLTLLTVDFAKTFLGSGDPAAVGIVAQTSTINSAAEIIFALLMGVLAVRFKHKSLLLVGVLLVGISSIGNFFAPTLGILQIFYAMEGVGTIIVAIMAYTMIGDLLPSSKKAKAVSYVVAMTSLAVLVGTPVIGFVTNVAGWRFVFIFLALPVAVAGLVLAFLTLPSGSMERHHAADKKAYSNSFKQVLSNRSAVSCLVGGIFGGAAGGLGLFGIAFYRQNFLGPMGFAEETIRGYAVAIMLIAAAMYVIASLVVGRLAKRFGAKTLTVAGALGNGVLIMTFFFMPSLLTALPFDMAHVWFAAAAVTAVQYLALDQVPKTRGTMMSLNMMFGTLGGLIGTAIGGLMLVLFHQYQAVGLALGALGITSAAVIYFFVKDPTRTQLQTS